MFAPVGYSEEIFKSRYAFDESETWTQACDRLASQMASVEKRPAYYRERFGQVIADNLFVPAGRIWYGSGRPQPNLLNCFALRSDLDSRIGWGGLANEMIQTSMAGGGCGTNFSDVRPEGAEINGQRGTCPGPIELMKLINGCGSPIRAGGARRTALMFGLSLRHPDIVDFINAKLKTGTLELANISVVGDDTEAFVQAVKDAAMWELSWKGRYKKKVSAKALWETIISGMWASAEPGFLNRELALSESTIYYIKKLMITNPCGEIWLEDYGACCLGHLVLPRFISESGEFNMEKLADTVRLAVRFLDNVLTVNTFPLPEMRETSQNLRRIGLGVTGFADALVILGLRYGSPEAVKWQDKLQRFISKVAYDESILLAVEKGPFAACDPDLHVKSGFVSRMPHKIKALIREHGIRNCALISQAPTGTVSILSGNCSGGIEPIFAPAYIRRYWDKEEQKAETVVHPLFAEFVAAGKNTEHFVASHELSLQDHLNVQVVAQRHTDNSVSKTINIAADFPVENLSAVMLEYLPKIKGTTVYRDGSRGQSPLTPLTDGEARKLAGHADGKVGADCAGGVCSL